MLTPNKTINPIDADRNRRQFASEMDQRQKM